MEVGPLARLLVAYASGSTSRSRRSSTGPSAQLGAPVAALFSTLGRTAARGLETLLVVHWMQEFYDDLMDNVKAGRHTYRTFTR